MSLDRWTDQVLLALAAALLLVVVRPLLAALATLLARLPGRAGSVAARVAAALRPGVARRALALVLGLGVPVTTALHVAPAAVASPIDRAVRPSARDVVRPAAPHATATSAATVVVVQRGDTLWDIARRHLPRGASTADVATSWPRWYAANRAVIGGDPGLLRPGQRLRVPLGVPLGVPRGVPGSTSARSTDGAAGPGAGLAVSLDPDRR
jgi:hypothetical protein